MLKYLFNSLPSVLIQSGCYFTDQLHSIQRLLKKRKHLTHLHVFDVNNHYPQGMDIQGSSLISSICKNFCREECYFEENYLRWFWGNVYTVLMKKEHLKSQIIIIESIMNQIYNGRNQKWKMYNGKHKQCWRKKKSLQGFYLFLWIQRQLSTHFQHLSLFIYNFYSILVIKRNFTYSS